MGARTSGREAALQMLFAMDAAQHTPKEVIYDFWREHPGGAEGRPYADELVAAIHEHRGELDKAIGESAANWRVERMTSVDRNTLRLGAYELMHRPDIPTEVILDEAVELAKRYGTENSSAFVNGVMSKLAAEHRGHRATPSTDRSEGKPEGQAESPESES